MIERKIMCKAGWAGAIALFAAGGAFAEVISVTGRAGDLPLFGSGVGGASGAAVPVVQSEEFFYDPLNPAGGRVAVSFSAECAIGGNSSNFVHLTIRAVQMVGATPVGTPTTLHPSTGNGDVFCSGDHTTAVDGRRMHAVNSYIDSGTRLPAGNYRIEVRALGISPSATAVPVSIGDATLHVWR